MADVAVGVDPVVEEAVDQFVKLDDRSKETKANLKEMKKVIVKHKRTIIDYMVKNKIDRFSGIKGGTQYLECSERTLKRRATSEQMMSKLAELMAQHVTDPTKILEAIQGAGGTYKEWRLSRRSKRITSAASAAALLAAAAAAAASSAGGPVSTAATAASAVVKKIKIKKKEVGAGGEKEKKTKRRLGGASTVASS